MLADQAGQPADCEILPNFSLEDLDKRSLDQYRNRFSSRSPALPWLKLDDQGLIEKLGGWRKDRNTGEEGLTAGGLLMFGKDEAICDPAALPQYHIDYRERLSSGTMKPSFTKQSWKRSSMRSFMLTSAGRVVSSSNGCEIGWSSRTTVRCCWESI